MIGAKAGQSVVFLGAADTALAAEVGRVTGLNGRTLVVDEGRAVRVEIERAAARAGALLEFHDAPVTRTLDEPAGTFDLAVLTTANWAVLAPEARHVTIGNAFALVRPGGRLIGVLTAGRRPRFGRPPHVPREIVDDALARFTAAGSRAVRCLADVPGTAYVEGVRPRAT
ncbi:MAG TPA: hypothetical protein VMM93_10755 [Vicinamibacterales bacterium]|nr:hypothetical protein [Vicinamibacterales bacterium]